MTLRARLAGSAVLVLAAFAACARAPRVRPPETQPVPPATASSSASSPEAGLVAATALGLIGSPYRSGGTTPFGFDCSGFVQYVFAERGIRLPRGVEEQFRAGRAIPRAEVAAGDLVFFATNGSGVSHVGIVTGRDAFVHAPSSGGQVRVEALSADYWTRRYAGARRIVGESNLTPR